MLILAQFGGIKTSRATTNPTLASPNTLNALINFHTTLTFKPSFPLSNSFLPTPSRLPLFLHQKLSN